MIGGSWSGGVGGSSSAYKNGEACACLPQLLLPSMLTGLM